MKHVASNTAGTIRMPPRLKVALGLLGALVLACVGYAILHEFCLVEARWLYR